MGYDTQQNDMIYEKTTRDYFSTALVSYHEIVSKKGRNKQRLNSLITYRLKTRDETQNVRQTRRLIFRSRIWS